MAIRNYVCIWKGVRPTNEELKIILEDHKDWVDKLKKTEYSKQEEWLSNNPHPPPIAPIVVLKCQGPHKNAAGEPATGEGPWIQMKNSQSSCAA